MQLYLKGFQKYEETTFTFPGRSVVYIEGENGAGKSTIFRAIYWVLYGKVRKISNWRAPDSSVTVTLRTEDGITITRTKKPKTIIVSIPNGQRLTGNVAQEYINSLYGHAETWLSTSYLIQDSYHPLISFDPSTRMKMLNKIAFDGDDPTQKIEKLGFAIKEYERKVTVLSAEERGTYSTYIQISNGAQPDDSRILDQQQYYSNFQELNLLNSQLPQLQSQLASLNIIAGKYDAYTDMLEKANNQLRIGNFPDENLLGKLQTQLHNYGIYINEKKKHDDLLKKLQILLKNHPETNLIKNYSSVEITKLSGSWNVYNDNLTLAGNLDVIYDINTINQKISECERLRDNQWVFHSTQKVTQLTARIEYISQNLIPEQELPAYIDRAKQEAIISDLRASSTKAITECSTKFSAETNAKMYEMNILNQKRRTEIISEYSNRKADIDNKILYNDQQLQMLDSSKCIHACPHCGSSIRLVNQKLEKSSQSTFDSEMYASVMKNRKELLEELQKLKLNELQDLARHDSEANVQITSLMETKSINKEVEENEIRAQYQSKIALAELELQKIREYELARESRQKQLTEIENLKAELLTVEDVEIPEGITHLTPEDLGRLNSKIYTLKQIKVVDKPEITLEQAKKSHHWHLTQNEIEKLKLQLSEIIIGDEVDKITQLEVTEVEQKLKEKNRIVASIQDIEGEISLLGQKPDTSSIVNELHRVSSRINEINTVLRESERMSRIKDSYTVAWNKHIECKTSMERLTAIREMYNIAIETQSQIHYNLIKSINVFLASVTPILFEEPITVTINTVKQNKMGNEVSCVNLRINYQGKEDRDIDSLSGGEKRMISTMISLAFSGLLSNKVIILDESMACLSPDKRDAMMKVIKHVAGDRIILVTCHGIHRGIFDHVIKL